MIQYIITYFLLLKTIKTQLQQCQCYFISDQFICEISNRCQWKENRCDQNPSYISKIGKKCEQFLQDECIQQQDCSYMNGLCIDFKGCELFTIDKCASSINCISNGHICIQKNECQNYVTQEACKNQDIYKGYCLWNIKQNPKCSKIQECSNLPILKSHIQCENALNQCTVDQKGNCTNKALQCIQYKIYQCYSTIDGNECFWNQLKGQCMEKICLNAQFSTDKQCKQYLQTCTTNGFHCIIRAQCNDITHINGCVVDIDGNECFWTGINCIKRVCQQIPLGENCYSYFSELDCVPTQSGDCKSRPKYCNQFETQDSCLLDYEQQQCYWINNQCILKTCQIAPQYSNCALWKDDISCVGDSDGYCIDMPQFCSLVIDMAYCYKQASGDLCQFNACTIAYCSKAPNNYDTHNQCEQWNIDCTVQLNNKNIGIGCMYKLQNCQDYQNQIQCQSTLDKIQCIYLNGECQEKKCEMGYFTNQVDCQIWKSDCIINEFENQCQDWPNNCYELISQLQCYIGLQSGVYCEWNGTQCQPQQNNNLCTNADNINLYDNHEQCNRWNGQCTVLQKVSGCEPRRNCEDYFLQHQCIIGIDNQQCFWDGVQCTKKCDGYSIETVDINECLGIDSTCQLNNFTAVCIYKTYCSVYKNKLDCKINNNDQPCKWNQIDQKCQDVICEDNITAITERECTYFLNYQQCYLDNIGCMTRPLKCYTILNDIICNQTIPRCQTTYCYYTDGCCTQILANQCESITDATTNQECQKYNPDCILNIVTGLGCMTSHNCEFIQDQTLCASINGTIQLPNGHTCQSYNGKCYSQFKCNGSHTNCNAIVINGVKCKSGIAGTCIEKQCTDFIGASNITNCQSFQSFCYYNGTKCATLLDCNDLTSYGQTVCLQGKTINGLYCSWNGTSCQTIQCSLISGTNCLLYNNKCIQGISNCIDINNCNQVIDEIYCKLAYNTSNLKCLWINSSCVDYFDCTNIFTHTYNEYQCIKYDLCRLSQTTVGCEFKSCNEYTQMEYCNKLNQCIWNNDQCQNNTECNVQLNQTNCENFTYCFWDTTTCKKNVCNTATTQQLCSQVILQSGNKCLWQNNTCKELYQCSSIQNPIFFEDCNNQNNGCVIKYTFIDKSSYCQTKKSNCSQYTSIYQCTKDIYENLCKWDLNTSTCIYNQCSTYITSNNTYNNWICQQFNKNCVLNTTLNGCRTILSSCNLYTTQQLCDYALITTYQYCYWDGLSCINAQCSQYNLLILPPISCEQFGQCNLVGGICQNKLISCNSYTNENLCNKTTDLSSNICAWINNTCVNKTCSNYPFNIFNHMNCQQWLKYCTVNQQETQCINIIDCTTAPQEIDTIKKCEQFISPSNQICTISQTQGGCTNLPSNCNFASRTQCVIDINRKKCYWSKQYGICKELICSNIDNTITTALDCESLLDECTLANSGFGCQNKASCNSYNNNTCKFLNIRDNNQRNCVQGCQITVCEDFYYQSDLYCKSKLNGQCITNGIQCITQQSCSDFRFDYQCLISRQGTQCLWYNNSCVNRKCDLADIKQYHNHFQCQNFMNTCTFSQLQNKCVIINQCSNYDNQESCTFDKFGSQCIWYQNQCYDTKCENTCGDGIINLDIEQCDDGNLKPNDGCYNCQYSCVIGCLNCQEGICIECDYEQGYYLDNNNNCITFCGDEIIQGKEQCDDGNFNQYDGCYNCYYQCHYACTLCYQGLCLECQFGWTISLQGQCEVICGDGIIVSTTDQQNEQCDDANIDSLDGCSSDCQIENRWYCINTYINGPSACQFTEQPSMVLKLLTLAPNLNQSTLLSFTSNLKYLGVRNYQDQPLLDAQIMYLNPALYKVQIENNNTFSSTSFDSVNYLINIEFLISVENPLLQVSFKHQEFIDENNQHPVNTKQSIRLYTCYYESESDLKISSTTAVFNSILLYILLAIAIISVLTGNLDIFWNLLDMVQYLSYIKYINIQFPSNLNSFFDLFRVITLQPLLDFIHFQTIINVFSFGETIFIRTTNKFKEDHINAFYFYNFGSSMLIFGITFGSFYISLLLIKAISKHIHHFYDHLYVLKLLQQMYRILVKFQFYFFYSGIIRIYLTNTYDILFTVLLQLYYPTFHSFITSLSVLIAGMSFCLVLIIIYMILSKQQSQTNGIADQYTVLSEGVTSNQGLWARQFNSLLLIKKLVFMLLLIFMQESGQLQTTLISITHISFALYLISKRPMKNQYEYYKMIFVESKITLATCFFILYSMPNLTLDQKYIIGWIHITIFTSILIFSVIFDLSYQLRVIRDKLLKLCGQKNVQNQKIILFETIPMKRSFK